MTHAHSKPLSSLGIKKMRVGKILADLGEYRGFRVTRNTAGIRYIYRFRLPHTDKLTHGTLLMVLYPGTLPRVITPTPLFSVGVIFRVVCARYSLAFLMSLVRVFPAIK